MGVRLQGDGWDVTVPAVRFQLCNSFFVDEKAGGGGEAILLGRLPSGRRTTMTISFDTPEAMDEAVVRVADLERCTLCDRKWKAMAVEPEGAGS